MGVVYKIVHGEELVPTYSAGQWVKGFGITYTVEEAKRWILDRYPSLKTAKTRAEYENVVGKRSNKPERLSPGSRDVTALMTDWVDGPEMNELGEVAP